MPKEEKSINEKLKESLVPDSEHPYKIPNNWIYIYSYGYIFNYEKGKKPTILIKQNDNSSYVPYINIKYFETGIANEYADINSTNKFCNQNDILIVWDGARSGLVGTNVSGALGSTLCKIVYNNNILNKNYVYRYFQSKFTEINKNTRGSGIPHVDPTYLKNMYFPLPPLAEQQRIVEKIESLFLKLDQAKENIENILATFENRKSAILHQAFSGELTKKWRKEAGVSFDSWEETMLGQKIKLLSGQDVDSKFCNALKIGIPYIMGASNLNNNTFIAERWIDNPKVISKRGDILFSVKGTIGKVHLQQEEQINISRQIMSLRTLSDINNIFLYYFMIFNATTFKEEGNGLIPGIRRETILGYPIYLPTIPEQKEIVRILDSVFEKEDKSKTLIDTLKQIDLMKKTILARAFRGELGTNNEEDEAFLFESEK